MSFRLKFCSLCILFISSCLPYQAKEFNRMGDDALSKKQYEQAVQFFSQSLEIEPDQPEVRSRLDNAQFWLRQIYVTRIYDTVDKPKPTIDEFLSAWTMSAQLAGVAVKPERMAEIRKDLSERLLASESRLRESNEEHRYYYVLTQMMTLVSDKNVGNTIASVGNELKATHIKLRDESDKKGLKGLALLHAVSAAIFAPWDVSLNPEANKRRTMLLQSHAIALALEVNAPAGGQEDVFLGGLHNRLPAVFAVQATAPLKLALKVERPETDQKEWENRHSAPCQVGSRQEKNPACETLTRQVESARARFEGDRRAYEAAANRCSSGTTAECTSYLSSAKGDLDRSQRDYEKVDYELGRCPRTIDIPVFKEFFYMRHTIARRAAISGHVVLTRSGQTIASRGVVGATEAQDEYGDGLACAKIQAEPLTIPSLASLQVQAEAQLLDQCFAELLQIRRAKAEAQLTDRKNEDEQIDGLVRARVIDASFTLAQTNLSAYLQKVWSADFDLPKRLVR